MHHPKNQQHNVTVRTPAKLILSGEHAVVYGHPALALAINKYTDITVHKVTPLHFSFHFMGLEDHHLITLPTLRKIKNKLKNKYIKYREGNLSIRDVLKKPTELSLFTLMNVLERLKKKLATGVHIINESNIPIGSGLGSSAASIVSLTYALTQLLGIELTLSEYVELGIESENLQHGISSGLDVHTVYHGGCFYYDQSNFQKRKPPAFSMQLIETGRPQSSTGECVAQAASYFKSSNIGTEFAKTTIALDQALQHNNQQDIIHLIKQNHRLLKQIGVVPAKVNDFINQVEQFGGSAKVCGAGSIEGDSAGAILVVSDKDVTDLAKAHGYLASFIQPDEVGTHVISS